MSAIIYVSNQLIYSCNQNGIADPGGRAL